MSPVMVRPWVRRGSIQGRGCKSGLRLGRRPLKSIAKAEPTRCHPVRVGCRRRRDANAWSRFLPPKTLSAPRVIMLRRPSALQAAAANESPNSEERRTVTRFLLLTVVLIAVVPAGIFWSLGDPITSVAWAIWWMVAWVGSCVGLARPILGTLSLAAATFLASKIGPFITPKLIESVPASEPMADKVSFGIAMIGSLIVLLMLVTRPLLRVLDRNPLLASINAGGGFCLGLAKGGLVLVLASSGLAYLAKQPDVMHGLSAGGVPGPFDIGAIVSDTSVAVEESRLGRFTSDWVPWDTIIESARSQGLPTMAGGGLAIPEFSGLSGVGGVPGGPNGFPGGFPGMMGGQSPAGSLPMGQLPLSALATEALSHHPIHGDAIRRGGVTSASPSQARAAVPGMPVQVPGMFPVSGDEPSAKASNRSPYTSSRSGRSTSSSSLTTSRGDSRSRSRSQSYRGMDPSKYLQQMGQLNF